VLVINRFDVDEAETDAFRADLVSVHDLLATRPGYLGGQVGRNVDEPRLWVLTTTWANVGAYRRAIGSYEAKLHAVPVLSRAIDEPSAYEVADPGAELNIASTRSIG
jgi:quinol monooxygenase YgiN